MLQSCHEQRPDRRHVFPRGAWPGRGSLGVARFSSKETRLEEAATDGPTAERRPDLEHSGHSSLALASVPTYRVAETVTQEGVSEHVVTQHRTNPRAPSPGGSPVHSMVVHRGGQGGPSALAPGGASLQHEREHPQGGRQGPDDRDVPGNGDTAAPTLGDRSLQRPRGQEASASDSGWVGRAGAAGSRVVGAGRVVWGNSRPTQATWVEDPPPVRLPPACLLRLPSSETFFATLLSLSPPAPPGPEVAHSFISSPLCPVNADCTDYIIFVVINGFCQEPGDSSRPRGTPCAGSGASAAAAPVGLVGEAPAPGGRHGLSH